MLNQNLLVILPFLIVVVTAMIVLLVDALLLSGKSKLPALLISLVGILCALGAVSSLRGQGYEGFNGTVVSDGFSVIFQLITLFVTALAILLSENYIQQKKINFGEYYALMLFSASGALIMESARELILIFVGLEILSIALYVLSGIARTEDKSEEAAVKYFLLGAFSSGFFLYGIALFYGGTGTTVLSNFSSIVATNSTNGTFSLASPYTVAGIAFLLVGLCFKAGIVPFHSWTPDVYQGAPTSVTAFMSAAAKAGAFAALIRIVDVILPVSDVWQNVLWVLAALTMVIGNVVALWQQDLKRMLAYSSIAHAGYILTGVLAANADGRAAVLFYMLVYSFMNIGAFGVIILLTKPGRDNSRVSDLQGLGKRDPAAAALMSLFMFSLAGIPPTAGFLGKFYILQAAIEAHLTGLCIVLVLSSVVGAYYYITVIWKMWFVPALDESEQQPLTWSPYTNIALSFSALMILLLFFFAKPVVEKFSDGTQTLDKGASAMAQSMLPQTGTPAQPVTVSELPSPATTLPK